VVEDRGFEPKPCADSPKPDIGQSEPNPCHLTPESSQQQRDVEGKHAEPTSCAADSLLSSGKPQSTTRAQRKVAEHNQSTTAEPLPVDLQLVVEAWAGLPDVVRSAIVGMVKGAVKGR